MRVRIFGRKLRTRSPRAIGLERAPEVMERRRLLTTYHVLSTSDDGSVGTLRWAIIQANQDQTPATIDFEIEGSGIQTIQLGAHLPVLTNFVSIDGTAQRGYSGSPLIELDGSKLPPGSDGLTLAAGGSTIRGLAINGFSGAGIVLTGGDGNVITGNDLGTDAIGQNARPNGVGILISGSSRNTIGGDFGSGGNVISGNITNGITISSDLPSSKNLIRGNLIGLDSAGLHPVPNRQNGIYLNDSSDNTIGGTIAGSGNVISGNGGSGIVIETDLGISDSNLIAGNAIGITAPGTPGAANLSDGIALFGATGTTIGGLTPWAGNVISGNVGNGLDLEDGTTSTLIQGNFLGTDRSGTIPIANQEDGIYLIDSPSNTIGGTSLASMNVISANFGNGIDAEGTSDNLLIRGNAIGTDPTGVLNLGNQSNGIYILSCQNMIGGTVAGAGNTIAYNGTGAVGTGIQLGDSAQKNSFLSNSIFGNHRLGINLGNGPTPNDDLDADTGGNGLQNYPILTVAQNDGLNTKVQGVLNSTPNTKFLIQFFSSPSPDMTGFGPGKELVGSTTVTTDENGDATFAPAGYDPTSGSYLTATATDPDGNTSEFSHAFSIQTVADLTISVTADKDRVHVGDALTYTITVSNRSAVTASSVSVTDLLDGSVSIQSITTPFGVTVSSFGNIVTANLGFLAGGDSISFTILVLPQDGAPETIANTATVESLSTDPDLTNNTNTVTTAVRAAADLGVSIVPDADSVQVLGVSTFTIAVRNQGPSTAHNAIVMVPLDASAGFVSISGAPDPKVGDDGSLSVNLGDLDPDESTTFKLVLKALAAPALEVDAKVSSDDDDLNSANDEASATEPVTAATDLGVSIATDRKSGYRGVGLVYTIVVRNNGPCDATGVIFDQALPDGTTLVSAVSDTGSAPVLDGNELKSTIGGLKSGASATLTITVQPTLDAPDSITTSVTVSGGLPELDPTNNTTTLQSPVADASDLSVVVTSAPSTAAIGQAVTYVFTVTNHGPGADPDAQFEDLLPPGLAFVSASSTRGIQPSYSAGKVTADLGSLGLNQSVTISVSVMPNPGVAGSLASTISIRGTNDDLAPSNNTTVAALAVAPVDLSAQLVASQDQVLTGGYFTLTATIRNLGDTRATDVRFSLPLSALVQCVSASSSSGSAAMHEDAVDGSIGSLEAGETATVMIQLRAVTSGSMTSTMTVSSDELNTDPGHGISSASNVIQESAGSIGFAAGNGQVLQTAGYATLSVIRSWGSAGTVTVNYQTVPGSAVAGRDYIPVSGTLTFLPGQTLQNIQVPVMATPHPQADYTVGLVLSLATSGAVLGPQASTVLTIHDPDPDTTPPRITDLSLSGPGKTVTSLTLAFSEAIESDTATDPRAFRVVNLGPDGRIGTPDDQPIAIGGMSYDPNRHTVTIGLLSPLPANHYFGIQVVASGPDAVHDVAGNSLDGSGTGLAGTSYAAVFARGSNLNYKDSHGNSVNLRLTGPGFLDQIRDANGDGLELILQNVVQGRSVLSGSVKRGHMGSGSTPLGVIDGLGTFGQIRVKLTSPAFIVRAYPFQQSSRNQPIASHVAKAKAGVKHAKPRLLARHPKKVGHR